MTSGTALVTGAAGFIGRAAVLRLAEAGFNVRAGLRKTPLDHGIKVAVAPIACDLDDPEQIRRAVSGADLVVHAAYGADGGMAAQCDRLLAAMAAEGVGGLVYLSSIAVYGARTGQITEADGPIGDPGAYGAAKLACEALVRDWTAAAPDRRAVILRPGVVYGRDSVLWVGKMLERIRIGALRDLGEAASAPAPLVHVDDLAQAILLAARNVSGPIPGMASAAAINIVGPETPSWRDYFAALAAQAGAPPLRPAGAVEQAFARTLAFPAKAWASLGFPGLRRYALAPAEGELALFRRDARFSNEQAERLLGFRPTVSLAEGLRRSVGP
ncbi:NAD(P)-dependent oxidoreductase [Methylopila sp. M107]|uniref:NAD-dependent epimerase/dehydratase family protein n=1 Tax=Methylopila sp. M107 TaxID=1101190 RepID=UPI00035F4BB0|nr:NAD(P)-dependent oxidoreductase [Methylopila sp. M107]